MASPFQIRFRQYANQQKLFQNGDRILAAVSGGVDSMVLLHLLHMEGVLAAVAHVNYRLRGSHAEEDQVFVEREAARLGIPCYTRKLEEGWFRDEKDSLQMEARTIRYKWFHEVLKTFHLNLVATAHHLDDQAETVLLQTVKGMSFTGSLGIPDKNGAVIRPMLFATRSEIMQYATEQSIYWREDQSNASDAYQRNLIRNKVIPVLREINPSFPESISIGKFKNAGIYEIFQSELERLKAKLIFKKSDGSFSIQMEELKKFKHPGSILFHLVEDYGFNPEICSAVFSAPTMQSGKYFLSDTHRLLMDRNEIHFSQIVKEGSTGFPVSIADHGSTEVGLHRLWIEETSCRIADLVDSNTAILDADKLLFPLEWRLWEHGDAFVPLGMTGHKKVSDLLIDAKIPVSEKEKLTVLLSGGKIAWIPGIRISNEFRLTDESVRAYRLEYRNLQA